MKVESLTREIVKDFVEYCKRYRTDIDSSFLYDEDLEGFELNPENPTYIIRNNKGEVGAAASLIIDDYNRRGKKARFRIFHSSNHNMDSYKILFQAILPHTKGLEKIFVFAPKYNQPLNLCIKMLGFTIDRYAFLYLKEGLEISEYDLPENFTIRSFRKGADESRWCEVRNKGFANLQGSETPITPEMVREMVSGEGYIEGGMMFLFHKDRPVGVVMGEDDDYDGVPAMLINTLAIIPEYQGRGLGRILLRAALQFAKGKSYNRAILSVNGENERAKSLYIQEGFKEVVAFICYKYDLIE